jgi:hypothetical protein
MWLDRIVVRGAIIAGVVTGGALGAGYLLRRSHDVPPAAAAPSDRAVCTRELKRVRAELARPGISDAEKVADIDALATRWRTIARNLPEDAARACRDEVAELTSEFARAYHRVAISEPSKHPFAARLYEIEIAGFVDTAIFGEDQYYYAELLWQLAERTTNPRVAAHEWERVANAFSAVVEAHRADAAKETEAAYAAVLAWKNALNGDHDGVSGDRDPRSARLISALRTYRAYVTDSDEIAGLEFLEASTLRRTGHGEEAIPLFRDVLDHHRNHETAEYAANLLLDTYNLLGRHAEMVALARSLAADRKFLADKPDLAATVSRLSR